MINQQYNLTSALPNGCYRNQDLAPNLSKFFICQSDDNIDIRYWSDMVNIDIDPSVYYSPSSAPYASYYDVTQGSLYKNYIVPTSAWTFNVVDNKVTIVIDPEPKISLKQYVDRLHQLISQEIDRIYQQHEHVVLQFSGGIDSLTTLSFVIAQGYLHRTSLVLFDNYVQSDHDPEQLRNHQARNQAVNNLFERYQSQAKNISRLSITDRSVINAFNQYSFIEFKTYGTTELMNMYQDVGFINGFHGNQILLHKAIFLDQIRLAGYSVEQVKEKLAQSDYYAQGMKSYDTAKNLLPMHQHSMQSRNRIDLNGNNGNAMYLPLAVGEILCRSIDFATVTVDDIVNANVARELINRNIGHAFDDYIICESLAECDNYIKKTFSRSLLDPAQLSVPKNISHDIAGLSWLENELAQDSIEHNSLISAKLMQLISSYHSRYKRY